MSGKNKRNLFQWAKDKDQWKHIIWPNETKIQLFELDGTISSQISQGYG